ncbi:hypothetical protein BY996DRAFT_6410152 [Phakopsora pachyrhizi]|uniref:Expressed protein n=1 Tax=Phakopsora pachyrhizi TaxID=170000 RepID=A0AAV0AK30_PHAPC|nr:hypothetical protein BY996DRAFT_6410152 [Phakopsora pachyrhizi]CAH7667941.1 expressed protein [Phakopsora pachyrhizi]
MIAKTIRPSINQSICHDRVLLTRNVLGNHYHRHQPCSPSPSPPQSLSPHQPRQSISTLLNSSQPQTLSLPHPPPQEPVSTKLQSNQPDIHPLVAILKNQNVWSNVLQSAGYDRDVEDATKALELVDRFGHDPLLLLGRVIISLENTPDLQEFEQIKHSLLQAGERANLSVSNAKTHAEVHAMLYQTPYAAVDAFESANAYVHKLEEAAKPPGTETYLQLFGFISYASLRRSNAVHLFNRMRLKAHPSPPISIWNAVLKVLGAGASPEPERSMDMFLEIRANNLKPTIQTYNYLIRAMCRMRRSAIGSQGRKMELEKWYNTALRFLNEMIFEDNLRPNLSTYSVLLEGAKRMGDLPRAKWTYGLFLRQLEIDRDSAFSDQRNLDWAHVQAVTSLLQTYSSFKPARKDLQLKLDDVSEAKSSLSNPEFFQTIPQNRLEVLREAEMLIGQFIKEKKIEGLQLSPHPQSRADQRKISFLVGSYLAVCSWHSTIEKLFDAYKSYTKQIKDYDGFGVIRNSWIYLIILERCESLRSPKKSGEVAREVFKEWESNLDELTKFEQVESVDSRLISQIWSTWIRLQAKYGGVEESLKEIERFRDRYPIKTAGKNSRPYLSFKNLEMVYHRLKESEDKAKMRKISRIVRGYEAEKRRKNLDILSSTI